MKQGTKDLFEGIGGTRMDYAVLKKNFEDHRFQTSYFETKEEAASYLKEQIVGKSVGFGGSVTTREMGLYEKLGENNQVYWHWEVPGPETYRNAHNADVYILSANGVAETGEIINIDGTGNRLAASIFGPKKVYYIVGKNKIAPDIPSAIKRAKDIAAAKNAVRLNRKTPCAATGVCHNCSSPDRICGMTLIVERPGTGMDVEILFVNEELGY